MSETRARKITAALAAQNADAIVLHSRENRRYLTRMNTSAGAVVVDKTGEVLFVTDFRYREAAKIAGESHGFTVLEAPRGEEDAVVLRILKERSAHHVLVERASITADHDERLRRNWPMALSGAGRLMETLRAVKEEEELTLIQKSQRIAEVSLKETLSRVKPGMTEKQVEAFLTMRLLENGSENGTFGIVAASGENAAMPHATPSSRVIERGDALLIDFGAIYEGYYSDITRTVAVGTASHEFERAYETVLAANNKAIEALHPAVTGGEIDRIARDMIGEAGYGDFFGHGLGHAVGLEIHEDPRLAPGRQDVLAAGNVVTVEPGIYLPGKFGIRIEDLLHITEDGVENLTAMPKELRVL